MKKNSVHDVNKIKLGKCKNEKERMLVFIETKIETDRQTVE